MEDGCGTAMFSSLGVVVMTIDYLSHEICWRPLWNELMGFMEMNTMGFSTVKAVGTPRLPWAVETVEVLRGKGCQGAPHSRLPGTMVALSAGLILVFLDVFPCLWLSSDTSAIQFPQSSFV